MISTVLARRYAKALFAVGKEEGKLESFAEALNEINSLLQESPDVEAALESPIVPPELKREVVDEIVKAANFEDSLANFLRLLVERGRIQHLRLIAEAFEALMDEETGRVRATVRTAVPIPDDLKDKVTAVLAKATGKEVILVTEEDPDLIGGVVAHVGDVVWDGSIKSQLAGLKESIGRGEQG